MDESKIVEPKLPVIGWREWVSLPELGVKRVKAKVDTGARSSSLHALDLEEFEKDGEPWIRFQVTPRQRSNLDAKVVEAKILEYRNVRSSNGTTALRPVILTEVRMLGTVWPVELTLANRDEMGFRMLLGREAYRGRFLVDAGGSFYGGKPKRKKKRNS